ncbi:unnamed protein product [Candidula unifasciata]|uniref:Transmembrane protein 254 n=1 Tax=Candidula unifasciata TaxID=100452 RepID=A0A8S3Z9H5_9EUPU|nr:unnamed protein product [Candidula unifasciata]
MAADGNIRRNGASGRNARNFDPNYFRLPTPFWMVTILSGLCLLAAATLSPESIPTYLGPVRTFGVYMGTSHPNVCVFISIGTVIIHILEAAYAGKVCLRRKMTTSATIKWILSTFVFGFSSLTLRLLPYKPDAKEK